MPVDLFNHKNCTDKEVLRVAGVQFLHAVDCIFS